MAAKQMAAVIGLRFGGLFGRVRFPRHWPKETHEGPPIRNLNAQDDYAPPAPSRQISQPLQNMLQPKKLCSANGFRVRKGRLNRRLAASLSKDILNNRGDVRHTPEWDSSGLLLPAQILAETSNDDRRIIDAG
jgi:hypothetical protein